MGQEVNQELKQLQEQLADVLEQMIAVCKRHNIDYYMAWGSSFKQYSLNLSSCE